MQRRAPRRPINGHAVPHSHPVNRCLALVRVDGTDIRKKIRKAYEKALRDLENSRRMLDRFHQTDQPQFTRWLNSNFGALLTELRELNQKLAADDAIVILVQNEVLFGGSSYARAYQRVMEIKENPEPPPPQPGGGAERMGLRAGDVLVAMSGMSLAGDSGAAAASLRRTVDGLPNGSAIAFQISRDGHTQTVSGPLASVYVPAMRLHVGDGMQVASNADGATAMTAERASGCGRISDFDAAPRQQQLHSAKIISIDGVTPGPTGATSYRVAAGSHVLTVANRIESRYLPFNDRARNSGVASAHYKKLTIDVAPDTTTLIAARLNEDKRNESQNDAYWDPVAWKQVAEACR